MNTLQHELFGRHPGGYDDDDDIVFIPRRQPRRRMPKRPTVTLKGSLKEIFNTEVKQALDEHKQLQGRFIFINEPEGQVISDIAPGKTGLRYEEDVDRFAQDMAYNAQRAGSSMAAYVPELGVATMAFTPLPFRLFTTQDQPYEMEAMATFYHELGHLIAPNAIATQTYALAENVADVYGILRHIQKYGDESKAIEVGSGSRAWRFVLTGQGDHFTTLSIDALPELLERLDLDALTPQQTANLASRIGLQNTPHVDVMAGVARNFQKVMPTILRHGLEEGLKEIAEVTLSSDQAYFTYKIGSSALKPFLDGKMKFDVETQIQLFGEQVSNDTSPIKLEGKYWDDVRRRMKERGEQLAKEGVLLGMPHLKEPKKPKAAATNDDTPSPPKKRDWGFGRF